MRAVRVERFGGPEVLVPADVPAPRAGAGEVVVGVEAADVIFLDTQLRTGWGKEYFALEPPYVAGGGVVGTVAEAGEGADPALVGTRVLSGTGERSPETGRTTAPQGGYAEYAAAPAAGVVPVPDGVGAEQALALLSDGVTAQLIADTVAPARGEAVVVAAAAGGLGSLLVQLANAAGARVIGAVRGERKRAWAAEQGAEHTVDYAQEGWTDRILELTGGAGADVVLDGAGAALGTAAFSLTKDGGRFVGYGAAGGDFAEIDRARAQERGIRALALLELPALDLAKERHLLQRLLDKVKQGEISPKVGQVFPLEKAEDAHRALAERTTLGKTLLRVADDG
ncbi:zinc-binding dehydrogenase [Nocardiopsis suaedae]|uniref:Zinc-binding dehydrogenase n=1 Tax=Nocardiopsis suaedae TaxID=3018444 RepID=A0ABT4THC7_9ACTN|nr:zinc-binding dehydrogenase [Nocardiopsis suaedae]MDA2804001.1 zinc-binding dehydrogenase [Nocardiopsis suaedae]